MPFSSEDKALIKNLYRLKIQVLENTGRMFEDKLQQGKRGNVINTDYGNTQHLPMA